MLPRLKPSELRTLLKHAIPARIPVLIVSPPGVGKTAITGQVTAELGYDLVTSHPSTEDPTDSKGVPWGDANGDIAFRPVGQLKRVLQATRDTVWFVDDLGQAPEAVQAPYLQWFHARECAGHRLPECVSIVAATNDRTHRANVRGVLEPLKSRMLIVELVPDIEEWCQWALQQPHMPPELVAYHRWKAGEESTADGQGTATGALLAFRPTADLVNSPNPRTWENAGKALSLNMPPAIEAAAVAGAVGIEAATDMLAFIRMFRELPNIDAILMNADTAPIPEKASARYAVVTALAARATDRNFARVVRYAERLHEAGHSEFASLLIHDSTRRNNNLCHTADYSKLMVSDLGRLITGGASNGKVA